MALSLLATLTLAASVSASALYSTYSFNPLHHLGGIAPYFESHDPPASPDTPQGCSAERAAYLVRHAAIYSNDFDFEAYIEPFVEKLENKTDIDWNKVPSLNFLSKWKAPISEAELEVLTNVGKLEATKLGVDLNFRYPGIKTPKQIWTSSADRTVKSAESLAHGLEPDDKEIGVTSVSEGSETGADSLTPYKSCPAYSGSRGSEESQVYKEIYATPIVERFNDLAPDFNFTVDDVFGMQQLCGYETVIHGKSPFCDLDLFSPDDWLGWEYSEDVRYHYNAGYGAEFSGYVGLPWLNASAHALMNNDQSDSDEDLLVSFTHRELPPMVIVAMGLFNNSEFSGANNINDTLPLDRINHRREWRSSHTLPFLGNIAIERLNCTGAYGFADGEYYRTLVNSAPQALPDCTDGPGTSCSREKFEIYLEKRADIFSEFSEKCGVEYDNSTDVLSIYESGSDN